MIYVKQEDEFGCGIACVAMILKSTYRDVAKEWNNEIGDFIDSHGTIMEERQEFLFRKGYFSYKKI